MPISAGPAIRKRTPFSVTVAIVAISEKNNAANPRTTSRTPKAVIDAHLPRRRSMASPRLWPEVSTLDIVPLPCDVVDPCRALANSFQFAENLGGVFHHGDDSTVIQPRRPNDAEHSGNAVVTRPQRRSDHRR